MKYILDSSVALKWVLPERFSRQARQLRDDYQKQIHELIAPDILPAETSHALTKAERRKIIPVGHAAGFLADILQSAPSCTLISLCWRGQPPFPHSSAWASTIASTSLWPSARGARWSRRTTSWSRISSRSFPSLCHSHHCRNTEERLTQAAIRVTEIAAVGSSREPLSRFASSTLGFSTQR